MLLASGNSIVEPATTALTRTHIRPLHSTCSDFNDLVSRNFLGRRQLWYSERCMVPPGAEPRWGPWPRLTPTAASEMALWAPDADRQFLRSQPGKLLYLPWARPGPKRFL